MNNPPHDSTDEGRIAQKWQHEATVDHHVEEVHITGDAGMRDNITINKQSILFYMCNIMSKKVKK